MSSVFRVSQPRPDQPTTDENGRCLKCGAYHDPEDARRAAGRYADNLEEFAPPNPYAAGIEQLRKERR